MNPERGAPREIDEKKRRGRRFLGYGIIFIAVMGLLIAFSNLNRLGGIIRSIAAGPFCLSIACSLVVYFFEGMYIVVILRILGIRIPPLKTLRYAFVINSFGYIVSLGGITHFATQIYFLGLHGVEPKKAALSRGMYVICFNVLFNIFICTGFILLLGSRQNETSLTATAAALFVYAVLVCLLYLTVFNRSFRRSVAGGLSWFLARLSGRLAERLGSKIASLDGLLTDIAEGLKGMVRNPRHFLSVASVSLPDIIIWVIVMYLSFRAVGFSIEPDTLIIGLSIGHIASIVSMIPGGMGALEGSMALTYRALGVPFETAVVAILLYRISFYIVPFLLSLPFCRFRPQNKKVTVP